MPSELINWKIAVVRLKMYSNKRWLNRYKSKAELFNEFLVALLKESGDGTSLVVGKDKVFGRSGLILPLRKVSRHNQKV